MRIILVGGNGFIGKNLVLELLKSKNEVVVIDKNIDNGYAGVEYVQGTISNELLLNEVIKPDDCVIHLGCTSVPSNSNHDISGDVLDNLIPTINLLKICKNKNIAKFIFTSSGGSIYGIPKYIPIDENHQTDPLSIYGVHKLTIEKYLAIFHRETGIQTISLRISNPYGRWQKPFTGQGVIPTFLASALIGKKLEIWGDGSSIRDYIYIEDLCEAFLKILNYSGEEQMFNVGSGLGTDLKTIVSIIEELIGSKLEVIYNESYEVEVNSNILDCCKMENLVSWSSHTCVRTGISNMLKFWNEDICSF